jgi:G2/mitotic-specific cyclin 3/4
MTTASTAGFRGPAKRAAFGDVTNLVKNNGHGREEAAKNVKIQLTTSHHDHSSYVYKENPLPGKEALGRPAQRLPGLASKPKASMVEETKRPARTTVSDSVRLVEDAIHLSTRQTHEQAHKPIAVPKQVTLDPAPLQPRHHKSQPHLKSQQTATLRKTQSKHFDNVAHAPTKTSSYSYTHRNEEVALQTLDERVAEIEYVDAVELPLVTEMPSMLPHQTEAVQLPSKTSAVAEANLALVAYKDSIAPAMSEPEEYWDEEDEEEYDDQDQAYTTAHSFRSRDLTAGGATTLLAPRMTVKVQRELEEARLEVEKNTTMEDLDEDSWDISMVAEYGDEIFEYMRELEVSTPTMLHYVLKLVTNNISPGPHAA